LPILFYDARKDFRLSFLVFLGAFLIGLFSTMMDSEFPRIILGNDYVDMTIENIKKGDPMAVYKDQGQFGMSVGITLNNLFVAFLTFVMGVFAAIGAIGILIKNGIMVGAFQFFFYKQGVFLESFLTIWMHGTLEIAAIIIAGGAGITMGKGLVFPGTLTRLKSFQITARRGLKIMIGLIPIFIIAGFIEGYITRHTEAPDALRAFFIFACLAFVLWYFIWFPYKKAQKRQDLNLSSFQLTAESDAEIDFNAIKSVGGLFADAFLFFRNHAWNIILIATTMSAFFSCTILAFHQAEQFSHLFQFGNVIQTIGQFFAHKQIIILPFLSIFCFTLLSIFYNHLILKKAENNAVQFEFYPLLILFIKALLPITLLYFLIQVGNAYTIYFILLLFPVVLLWLFLMQKENIWYIQGLTRTFHLMGAAYFKLVSLSFILLVLGVLFFSLLDTSLVWFFVDIISWNLPFKGISGTNVLHFLMLFTTLLVFFLLYPLFLFGIGLYSFSQTEVKEANALKAMVKEIGKKKEIQGIAME
jgi:uncharacterized membrane protein SpoIIM required for sporulation